MSIKDWFNDDNTTKKVSKDLLEAIGGYAKARRDTVYQRYQLKMAEVNETGRKEMLELEKEIENE